jgi:MYXO-CTERM domain-containing protein
MKKALLTLAIAAVGAASSYAATTDGFITFQFFGDGSAAQTIHDSANAPVNNTYTVGLFAGDVTGAANANATPIATTTVFGAGTGADPATGLFQYSGSDVAIPGSTPGQSTTLTLKAWKGGATFATATSRGEASFTTAPLGGINPTPPPPSLTAPDLSGGAGVGFKGLTVVTVPEPATLALGVLGLGALGLIRRRK